MSNDNEQPITREQLRVLKNAASQANKRYSAALKKFNAAKRAAKKASTT